MALTTGAHGSMPPRGAPGANERSQQGPQAAVASTASSDDVAIYEAVGRECLGKTKQHGLNFRIKVGLLETRDLPTCTCAPILATPSPYSRVAARAWIKRAAQDCICPLSLAEAQGSRKESPGEEEGAAVPEERLAL